MLDSGLADDDAGDSRDLATQRALEEMDPELAGLFRLGRELCGRAEEPGLAYLIAHAGRELVRGVIKQLEVPTPSHAAASFEALETSTELARELEDRLALLLGDARASEAPTFLRSVFEVLHTRSAADEEDLLREGFRRRIASALSLSPNHALVLQWFSVHARMQRAAHARAEAPNAGPLRAAFDELARLLYGRVGPIFETQRDLDRLAAILDPSARDIDGVRQLIPRAVQRRYFFRRLQSAAWVAPLRAAGLFRHPPERETFADGSWRMRPWPEGDYLLRMAAPAPGEVLTALHEVPPDVENPIVWDVVADAVSALPADLAARLSPQLVAALRRPLGIHTSRRAIAAAARLAREGRDEAFSVAETLLYCAARAALPEQIAHESSATFIDRLREFGLPFIRGDAWALSRIARHDMDDVFGTLIPSLELLDGRRTFDLLRSTLMRSVRSVRGDRCRIRDRILQALAAEQSIEGADQPGDTDRPLEPLGPPFHFVDVLGATDDEAGDSHRWCDDLDSRDPDDGVRAQLARAVLAASRRQIAAGTPAVDIIAALDQGSEEICRRIQWQLMVALPQLDQDLQRRLDDLLTSDEGLSPPYKAREIAALLRAHFANASEAAQAAFASAIARGPADVLINNIIAFRGESNEEMVRAGIVADWQRRRIRWFHDRIPPALAQLAERLGVTGAIPEPSQRSLDETGFWSGGVTSVSARSPMPAELLAELSPTELARYLEAWQPVASGGDPFESPTREGLRDALRALLGESPDRIQPLLAALASRQISLSYVAAMVGAAQTAIRNGTRVALDHVLALAQYAWREASQFRETIHEDSRLPLWTAVGVMDLIEAALRSEVKSHERVEALWEFTRVALASDLTWRSIEEPDVPATIEQVALLSRSVLAGRVVDVVIEIAWQDFLLDHEGLEWPPPGETRAGGRLVPLLELGLDRAGSASIAVEAVVGENLERLLWMSREWVTSSLERLFAGGSEDPLHHPAWAMYVWRGRLLAPAFDALRPWYQRAAQALPVNGVAPEYDSNWVLGDALAKGLLLAVTHGVSSVDDDRELLALTFNRVPVKTRNHAYWMIYRRWSDAEVGVVRERSPCVIGFWEWRLGEVERLAATADREEEADGLSWFLATPHLPDADVIRLGTRTVALLGSRHHTTSLAWTRLATLAAVDPEGTFVIVERLVHLSLNSDHPYLPFDEVAPVLRPALRATDALRSRVLALINRIGEAGLDDYRALWNA